MSAMLDAEAGSVARYELPEVEGPLLGTHDTVASMPTARQLAELQQQAYAEAYEQGEAEGYAAGERKAEQALRERAQRLDAILGTLARPLAEVDEELVEAVAELSVLIARHLVRRELRTEPGEVVGVVRETMRQLPVATRGTRLRLNPDDVELVRSALALGDDGQTWRTEADPLITRGGCVVESESSRIDATVESRLAAIASKMFGGERGSDRA